MPMAVNQKWSTVFMDILVVKLNWKYLHECSPKAVLPSYQILSVSMASRLVTGHVPGHDGAMSPGESCWALCFCSLRTTRFRILHLRLVSFWQFHLDTLVHCWVCAGAHVSKWRPEVDAIILQLPLRLSLGGKVSPWTQRSLTYLDWLASCPEMLLSPSSQHRDCRPWDYTACWDAWISHMGMGSRFRFLCLQNRCSQMSLLCPTNCF